MELTDYLQLRGFARSVLGAQLGELRDEMTEFARASELLVSGLPAAETSAAAMLRNLSMLRYLTENAPSLHDDMAAFTRHVRTHAAALAAHLPERQAAELLRVVAVALPEATPGAEVEERMRGDHEWKALAQAEARRIIKGDAERGFFAPQTNIADRVAAELKRRGVVGADGKPLSGGNIKRNAMKGISSATKRAHSTITKRGN